MSTVSVHGEKTFFLSTQSQYCFFINKILGVNFDVNPDRPTKIPKTIFPKNKTYKKNIYLDAITAAWLRNALS